jgi:tetratricopeptide (TPR) repeat protein
MGAGVTRRRASPAAAAKPAPVRRRWVTLFAVGLGVALVWLGAGELTRRARAARLPPLPDLTSSTAPVRAYLIDADAAARARPASAADVGALGIAYHASLLDDHALRAYAAAEALDPAAWQWVYYRALVSESHGRTDVALELLAKVTDLNPSLGLAWFRIGEAQLKRQRFAAAQQAYERALAAPPAQALGEPSSRTLPLSAYATVGLARVAAEQGNVVAANELIDRALREHPRFGPALQLKQQRAAGGPAQPSSARAYVPPADPLLDAVVGVSRHSDLLLKHAALAARAGDRPWREFLTRRALQFTPRNPDVLLEMSAMLQAAGNPAEALVHLKQHEEVAPHDHHGLVEQGKCLSDLGRFAEAEQVLRRAVRVPDAAAEYNLGLSLDRQGRWDEARRHYERALALDPFHARALNNLAVGTAQRGNIAAARQLHARALQAAPDDAEVRSNAATTLLMDGRTADAIALLEQALAIDPESADVHNTLGVALGQSGRLADAAAHFREAVRLSPGHQDARRNLERVAAVVGRP